MFNLKMSKEMKKFWNLMLAVLVMLGAAACTETDESVDAGYKAGVSFYATFGGDDTRAYIDDADGDKKWTTIWESGDTLSVTNTADNSSYTFVCADAATGKFTCEDSDAANLVGKSVSISSDSNIHPRDSRLGKKALCVWTTDVTFTQDATIQLTSQTSFLRYTYKGEGDVTLKLVLQASDGSEVYAFIYNKEETNEITFSGIKGENFVPFWCGVNSTDVERNATLSYSIDGVKVKETTINGIGCGKVYNLGTLTEPENLAKVYLVPNDGWKADGAWFSAHFFNSTDGFADVKMTDADADGIYECSVPADMENVLFCRMNPAFTEFAWNEEGATDENLHVWNQTADEVVGVEPDNYYYILDWAKGIWGNKDGYVIPEEPALSWVLTGSYCEWSETGNAMAETATANLFVFEGLELAAGAEIKVKASHTWDINYGGGIVGLNANNWMKAYLNGSNIVVVNAGTYDVYFEYDALGEYSKFYLMEAGVDYTTAEEQTENGVENPDEGETPDDTERSVGVIGFGGNWETDIDMTLEGDFYTLKGKDIYATDSFKIRINDAWDESYGVESLIEDNAINADELYTLVQGGKNMMVPAGVYNLYFNYTTKEFKAERVGNLDTQETPDQPSSWSLCGTFNNWGDTAMVTTEVKNLFVAKSVALDAYASFKVRKDKGWSENYGGGIVYMNPNGYIQVYANGADISNTAAGTFDFYFDYTSKLLYMVDAGADYTAVAKQTVDGEEPKQEEPEVTENKLYLKPNANWKKDNARFAAYFWGSGDKWVSMTDSDGDGIYELNIPEGYDYGCNVIFCRMNPNTTANNWNNKWNQTSDLKAPTDGKNLYTVKENTWDKGGGTWSTK